MELALGTVIAALITTGGFVYINRSVKAVHAEVRTNHGKRAGEYLETLPDVMAEGLTNMGQVLADALAEHTMSDAENFEELRHMLKVQDERAAEARALRRAERARDGRS